MAIVQSKYRDAAQMEANIDNATPYVGENGNWWRWDVDAEAYVDTGTPARGPQGEKGNKGDQGDIGPPGAPGGVVSAFGRVGDVVAQAGDYTPDMVGASNRNLLHNWDFRNPVNQRGISGTFSTIGAYFIDRWKLISGTVTLTGNGLTLNGTIAQPLETAAGTDVFASVRMNSGVATASYNNAAKTFSITSTGGTVEAAKLELGTVSTLANDPPADYGEQLVKCQRYSVPLMQFARVLSALVLGGSIDFVVPVPVTLRTAPTIVGELIVETISGVAQAGFTFTIQSSASGYVVIRATKASHGLDRAVLNFGPNTYLDANL